VRSAAASVRRKTNLELSRYPVFQETRHELHVVRLGDALVRQKIGHWENDDHTLSVKDLRQKPLALAREEHSLLAADVADPAVAENGHFGHGIREHAALSLVERSVPPVRAIIENHAVALNLGRRRSVEVELDPSLDRVIELFRRARREKENSAAFDPGDEGIRLGGGDRSRRLEHEEARLASERGEAASTGAYRVAELAQPKAKCACSLRRAVAYGERTSGGSRDRDLEHDDRDQERSQGRCLDQTDAGRAGRLRPELGRVPPRGHDGEDENDENETDGDGGERGPGDRKTLASPGVGSELGPRQDAFEEAARQIGIGVHLRFALSLGIRCARPPAVHGTPL
jgi:hypothetical protein